MIWENLNEIGFGLAYVVIAVFLLIFAKLVKDVLTPYKIDEQLTIKDNPAVGLSVTGYLAGVTIIFLGAVTGDDVPLADLSRNQLLQSVGVDVLYAIAGILALNVGRLVVDKLVLYKFSTRKELIDDRNAGTGAVEFGAYIATGLVVAGAISGSGGGWWSALAFFALGQIALVVFSLFYQLITAYDVHKEIERDNVAAGVALGLAQVALGVILFKAVSGDFISWTDNLINFGVYAGLGFVLLLLLLKITDWVFLPKSTLAHEIANDRNVSAAWIEGIINISVAVVICFML